MDIYTDGSSLNNPGSGGAAAAGYARGSLVPIWTEQKYLGKRITNNEAEYHAMIMALTRVLKEIPRFPGGQVRVYTDSMLVKNQVQGKWRVKAKNLASLHRTAVDLLGSLQKVTRVEFYHVRAHCGDVRNELVDDLARAAAQCV